MSRRYAIDGQDSTVANESILGLTSTANIRPKIYDILCGSDATPADNAFEFVLQRFTAAGTSTAVVPTALDPGDPAATGIAGEAHTVEPTYTANLILLMWMMNQRATFRWVAAPGSEFVMPATAANGLGVQPITVGAAVNFGLHVLYAE